MSPIRSGVRRDYVFVYGSLLSPVSLLSTLPGCDLDEAVPARLLDNERVFGVVFPNDGSQPDKAYYDEHGERPRYVLFANVTPKTGSSVNGVLVPVDGGGLHTLRMRERRYAPVDATSAVESGLTADLARILTFIGRVEFTDPVQVAEGVVPRPYLDAMHDGARFWDEQCPGFLADFHSSTRMPTADSIVGLRRVQLT